MQVYRELRVLTARPTVDEETRVPHRLYGVLSAAEACSAGRWREMAVPAIAAAHRAGQVPIVVGGTGLYFRALTEGLAPIPAVPEEVRAAARAAFDRLGQERFRTALAERDPVMAGRLVPRDRQRLIRAYEVIEATGMSLADWQSLPPDRPRPGRPGCLPWSWSRNGRSLYARCDARLDRMIAEGALDEVRGLMESRPGSRPAGHEGARRPRPRAASGRRNRSGNRSSSRAKTQTRRYAKRQGTWFRNQIRDGFVVSAQDLERSEERNLSENLRIFVDRVVPDRLGCAPSATRANPSGHGFASVAVCASIPVVWRRLVTATGKRYRLGLQRRCCAEVIPGHPLPRPQSPQGYPHGWLGRGSGSPAQTKTELTTQGTCFGGKDSAMSGQEMSGAEIVIKALADQGVDVVFGYPGGAVLPLYDALFKQNRIRHVLVRQEAGAVHAAEGYARSTGKPGVVLVTSGPGATNAVTGLTDALMDSIPVVCLTGQVATHMIGNDAFQECDTTGITRPCTKHNYLVKDVERPRPRDARGVLRRQQRPAGPGRGRSSEGRADRHRHLCRAVQRHPQDLSAAGQRRSRQDQAGCGHDRPRPSADLLCWRRRDQFRPESVAVADRIRPRDRLSDHQHPDGSRHLSSVGQAVRRDARHARHLRSQSLHASVRRDDLHRRPLRRPYHRPAGCLLAELEEDPHRHRSQLDQQEHRGRPGDHRRCRACVGRHDQGLENRRASAERRRAGRPGGPRSSSGASATR